MIYSASHPPTGKASPTGKLPPTGINWHHQLAKYSSPIPDPASLFLASCLCPQLPSPLCPRPRPRPLPLPTPRTTLYPLPTATPTPTPTATAHNYPLPSITVQPVPSLHRLTEVIWVKILQTMVPIVTNDSGGTIYYEVFRMVAKSHTKWANFLGPKSIGNDSWGSFQEDAPRR